MALWIYIYSTEIGTSDRVELAYSSISTVGFFYAIIPYIYNR